MGRIESVNPAACSRFRAILHYKTSRSRNWHRARQYLRLRKAIRGHRHDLQRDRSRYDSKSLSTAICSHEGRALGKRSRQAVASGYRARFARGQSGSPRAHVATIAAPWIRRRGGRGGTVRTRETPSDRSRYLVQRRHMPGGLTGYELAARARALSPTIRILLTSGYDAELAAAQDTTMSSLKVLRKPYKQAELARALRDVLGD